jgi:hypothetical protein
MEYILLEKVDISIKIIMKNILEFLSEMKKEILFTLLV